MTNDEHYYKELLRRYLENRCNSEELNELMDFLGKDASNTIILLQLQEQYPNSFNENTQISLKRSNLIREALLQKIVPPSCHTYSQKQVAFCSSSFNYFNECRFFFSFNKYK